MKWLVVFPNPTAAILERRALLDLPPIPIKELEFGIDEVMQVVNLLGAKLLSGKQATIHGLLDILAQGWEGIWLITHSDEAGWYLSDGIVNASETTTLVRSSGTELLVMNTCSSYEVAFKVSKELGTPVICTIKEVPDRQAFITGVIFAQKLAKGMHYEQAYEEAKPGENSTYELIEARKVSMNPNDRSRFTQGGPGVLTPETIISLQTSVRELDEIINGIPRVDAPGLKTIVKELGADLKGIRTELAEIKERQKVRNWYMIAMAIIIGLLVLILVLVAFWIGGLP